MNLEKLTVMTHLVGVAQIEMQGSIAIFSFFILFKKALRII